MDEKRIFEFDNFEIENDIEYEKRIEEENLAKAKEKERVRKKRRNDALKKKEREQIAKTYEKTRRYHPFVWYITKEGTVKKDSAGTRTSYLKRQSNKKIRKEYVRKDILPSTPGEYKKTFDYKWELF